LQLEQQEESGDERLHLEKINSVSAQAARNHLLPCHWLAGRRLITFRYQSVGSERVLIVIAAYYVLFAVMGGSNNALLLETLAGTLFVAVAVWGFKSSLWLVVAALALHGFFDIGHDAVIANPGVPGWWPEFCLTADVAWLLGSERLRASATAGNVGA